MSKTNYFNLNEFKNGKSATTKLGNPVKFITMCGDKILVKVSPRFRIIDGPTKYVVSAAESYTCKYNLDGKKYKGTDTEYDLVMDAPSRPRNEKGQFIKVK